MESDGGARVLLTLHESALDCEGFGYRWQGELEYKEEEFKLFGRPRGGRRVLADNTANCQSQEQ